MPPPPTPPPSSPSPSPPPPPAEPDWPIPTFTLEVQDVEHAGARLFFDHLQPTAAMREAVIAVYTWLYTPETVPSTVATLKLVLRPMPGVGHTFGADGGAHKETHISLLHVVNSAPRAAHEVRGVLVHEFVHAFQYDARGTCPGGLIEGIADFVRLHAQLGPPHWKERTKIDADDMAWDAGYEKTAYFLDWIERCYGAGTIRALNLALKDTEYVPEIWRVVVGEDVEELWRMYKAYINVVNGDADTAKE